MWLASEVVLVQGSATFLCVLRDILNIKVKKNDIVLSKGHKNTEVLNKFPSNR